MSDRHEGAFWAIERFRLNWNKWRSSGGRFYVMAVSSWTSASWEELQKMREDYNLYSQVRFFEDLSPGQIQSIPPDIAKEIDRVFDDAMTAAMAEVFKDGGLLWEHRNRLLRDAEKEALERVGLLRALSKDE